MEEGDKFRRGAEIGKHIGKFTIATCGHCGSHRRVLSGRWMRVARKRTGISLTTMANKIGITKSYLCDIELGHRWCTKKIERFYEEL